MGYNVKFSGKLMIAEPFVLGRDDPRPEFQLGKEADLHLWVKREEVDVPGVGKATVVRAVGFTPTDSERMGYTAEDIKVAADWVASHGTHLTGFIMVTGEEGDISRYRVDDGGESVSEQPKLIWPNGDVTEHG